MPLLFGRWVYRTVAAVGVGLIWIYVWPVVARAGLEGTWIAIIYATPTAVILIAFWIIDEVWSEFDAARRASTQRTRL